MCTRAAQDSREVLLHKVQETPLDWLQHRRYWVQWAGQGTVEEVPHTVEHCDDTEGCSTALSVGNERACETWSS